MPTSVNAYLSLQGSAGRTGGEPECPECVPQPQSQRPSPDPGRVCPGSPHLLHQVPHCPGHLLLWSGGRGYHRVRERGLTQSLSQAPQHRRELQQIHVRWEHDVCVCVCVLCVCVVCVCCVCVCVFCVCVCVVCVCVLCVCVLHACVRACMRACVGTL